MKNCNNEESKPLTPYVPLQTYLMSSLTITEYQREETNRTFKINNNICKTRKTRPINVAMIAVAFGYSFAPRCQIILSVSCRCATLYSKSKMRKAVRQNCIECSLPLFNILKVCAWFETSKTQACPMQEQRNTNMRTLNWKFKLCNWSWKNFLSWF